MILSAPSNSDCFMAHFGPADRHVVYGPVGARGPVTPWRGITRDRGAVYDDCVTPRVGKL